MSRKCVIGWDEENVALQETTKHTLGVRGLRKDSDDPIYQMEHVYYAREDRKLLMSLDYTQRLMHKSELPDHVKALLCIHGIL